MNRNEADQIATAITAIRPDWRKDSMVEMLAKHQHRSARDAFLALGWIAYDPETKTPGRINEDGPWWSITRLAGVEVNPPPYFSRTPTQREDKPATPEKAREHIAAIRQALHREDQA